MYITRLEVEKSYEFARSLEMDDMNNVFSYFEADVATALNIAGMKALKQIGKNPIIRSSLGTPEEINQDRIKEIIKDELNLYLTTHYVDTMFSHGQYAITVVLQNETPIPSRENISLESIPMQLKRQTLPFIGPREITNHTTYLVASVPLTIEVRTVHEVLQKPLTTRTIVVSSILTSRYSLLEGLMNEYHQSINGTFSPLWTLTTTVSNAYSLLRGFKHFRCGKPLNVMDNRHLSLILNSGLLLTQSLVFGSVDPLGLVHLVQQTQKVLKQSPSDALFTFNTQMLGEGYMVSTENLTSGTANVDAESPLNESIDLCSSLSLSEIGQRVLYNISTITLHFENDEGQCDEVVIPFDDQAFVRIDETIQQWANQSFFLSGMTKGLSLNMTTQKKLHSMIADLYHASLSTQVVHRSVIDEQWGDPGIGWTDGGVSQWTCFSFTPISKNVIKPVKGQIIPGSALYEEQYFVSYERIHCWWKIETYVINGTMTQVQVWNNVTDILIESATLQSILEHYAIYQETQDDVVDILYANETLDDLNLEDTLDKYLVISDDSQPEKQVLIMTRENMGSIGLSAMVDGGVSDWVAEEAFCALVDIGGQIGDIILNPEIDLIHYPDPVDFVETAKNDLLTQYDTHLSEYLNFLAYCPDNGFLSVGKKAVYCAREWYVGLVRTMAEMVLCNVSEKLSAAFDTTISSYTDFTSKNLTNTLADVSDAIRNQFTIPFGYLMNLSRFRQGTKIWNETVRLAVDYVPHYLDPFEKTQWGDEELWTLKIRNRCLFGPTGLPLLPPTPVTPWLLTMNCWVIDVQGEYAQVKLIDTTDETIFHPLLGHEPQTYVRELKIITASNITIGENTRLSFSFTTVAFGIVPPWGMMVGDIQSNWFDDHTAGFDKEEES